MTDPKWPHNYQQNIFHPGRSISLQYLQDRLTSVQKLHRNERDKEAVLWLISRACFLPPLLSLDLVRLVWAA